MKSTTNFILTSFLILFIGFSVHSQQSNDNKLLEEAKKESEKVSQHLDISNEQQVLLYRAIYSYKSGKAKINSVDDMSENEKEEYLQKMETSFRSNVKHALGGDEQLKQKFFNHYKKK